MKDLKSKLKKFGMGTAIILSPLLFKNNAYSQITDSTQTQDSAIVEENPWDFYFGTMGMIPHEKGFEEIFDSYFGVTASAERNLKKDLNLKAFVTGVFGSYKEKELELNLSQWEFGALAVYNTSGFSAGLGPKIVSTTFGGKYVTETIGLTNRWASYEDETYSGLGWEFEMGYDVFQKENFKVNIFAGYSKVIYEDSDTKEETDLGTTKFGLQLVF